MRWFIHAFKNIFNYRGRARRAEYGWFMLINLLIQLAGFLVFWVVIAGLSLNTTDISLVLGSIGIIYYIASFIYSILAFFVSLSLTTRRLHDLGRSGWWQLFIYLLPLFLLGATFVSLPILEEGTPSTPIVAINIMTTVASLIYLIFFLILLFKDGQKQTNKYGESPKYPSQVEQNSNERIEPSL
ncbi:DUF805 domain-containing protein [Ursidibacter maritimus]|uniref:DUF805 domain-containing protein n=1 Tax=Ursidibacter maritimus TaxID=1331689 RepID=A0A949T633_9PAST|nr:DUF805 domain-containing protein [Ursidibacter maritimus]KAE9538385.1 hypothetical protein A1D26_05935 [Ursidibacter maritimus]MBV6523432.1 DUF805 domain-containing protein [Ursidibacter maritimus]MBV6525883.1 DUF805 domain-containing protein [Ursidibacter maritimus]MBV6528223.1 DUF805 domain-containing protein [Ursidibacter maritimus]MBV6529354.1 DUF805 domain-containing protein [Ursidibacter maritimus]